MENDDFVKKWLNEKEIFLLDDEYLRISKLANNRQANLDIDFYFTKIGDIASELQLDTKMGHSMINLWARLFAKRIIVGRPKVTLKVEYF